MFMDVARAPCLAGKWFCRMDWKELTKKQQGAVERYIKNPSEFAVLVVVFTEFPDYSKWLKNRVLSGSNVSHLIQLSFPTRNGLRTLIEEKLAQGGAVATRDAIDTFILRMSNDYDSYDETLENIAQAYGSTTITRTEMQEALKGVENYVLDDLVAQLTVPAKSLKPAINRKSVKMLRVLLEEYGARALTMKLRAKVRDIIQMRMLINKGIVPVRLRYSVTEVKKRIPDDNRIKGINDYSFKRLAQTASMTSLRDWVWVLMILNSPKSEYDTAEYERMLFNLINRAAFSENRLYNIIGVLDNLGLSPEFIQEIERQQLAEECEQRSREAYKKACLQPKRYSVFGEVV